MMNVKIKIKVALLKELGKPLIAEHINDPALGTGGEIAEVVVAPVLYYADEVFNGEI